MAIFIWTSEIDSQAAEKEKDRQRDILVAEIRAAGYGAMADVNKNEMSDNLKALFRPLSIIIPDNKEIAVNILYSEGNI